MKSLLAISLCLLCLLPGCRASRDPVTQPDVQSATESTVEIIPIPPESVEVTVPKPVPGEEAGETPPMIMGGSVRLTYTGNVSGVRYVTSPESLPEIPELQKYDAAWFRENALILVTETVTGGSIQVGIRDIRLEGERAFVVLSREMQGDVGTTVMTTWLLWAEVDRGLAYSWTVENPALPPEGERS
jgi:hypothetical protein